MVKERSSNLELYRIIVMLSIVAHHYVVNSGLMEVLKQDPMVRVVSITTCLARGGRSELIALCSLLVTLCVNQMSHCKNS